MRGANRTRVFSRRQIFHKVVVLSARSVACAGHGRLTPVCVYIYIMYLYSLPTLPCAHARLYNNSRGLNGQCSQKIFAFHVSSFFFP